MICNKVRLNNYFLYGKHAVFAALENPKRNVLRIYCNKAIYNKNMSLIQNFPHIVVTNDSELEKVIGSNVDHQGVIARVSYMSNNKINNISEEVKRVVILDHITDVHNIGSIIRSAAAFGIEDIIVPEDNFPMENAVIAKTASGALELVNIYRVVNLSHAVRILKKMGFWIIGLEASGGEVLSKKVINEYNKIAIILGSEGRGIRRLIKEKCDLLMRIEMSKRMESLNVSNAAAIFFHESHHV